MKTVSDIGSFRKDFKLCQKRRKDMHKLAEVIRLLEHEEAIPAKYRLHKLIGNYAGHWELHIEPDWLLIFRYEDDYIILTRTGTHSDLFK